MSKYLCVYIYVLIYTHTHWFNVCSLVFKMLWWIIKVINIYKFSRLHISFDLLHPKSASNLNLFVTFSLIWIKWINEFSANSIKKCKIIQIDANFRPEKNHLLLEVGNVKIPGWDQTNSLYFEVHIKCELSWTSVEEKGKNKV